MRNEEPGHSNFAIWNRLLGTMPPEAAAYLLNLDFPEPDHQRMHELAEASSVGSLSPEEQEELECYVYVGDVLTLLQTLAKSSLSART